MRSLPASSARSPAMLSVPAVSAQLRSWLVVSFCLCCAWGKDSGLATKLTLEDCLGCLCIAETGCDNTIDCSVSCGLFYMTKAFWEDAGAMLLPGEQEPGSEQAWQRCAKDSHCAARSVKQYLETYETDCDDDGKVTCLDYAKIFKNGGGSRCKEPIEEDFKRAVLQCMEDVVQKQWYIY